jgi:hypothetical protein
MRFITFTSLEAAMSLQERSAWINLVCLLGVYGAYGVWAAAAPRTPGAVVAGVIGAAIGVAVAAIALNIMSAILSRREDRVRPDERDRVIAWRARGFAYLVVISAVGVSPALYFFHPDAIGLANAVLGVMVAAEVARYGAQVFLYRRGL